VAKLNLIKSRQRTNYRQRFRKLLPSNQLSQKSCSIHRYKKNSKIPASIFIKRIAKSESKKSKEKEEKIMETKTISKAEMKAIPEPFSYNLFLLLDIALLSMFLFIHIFPFSHYFYSFTFFEDSENLCGKWSSWNLILSMA
jgi:hypothetical protein